LEEHSLKKAIVVGLAAAALGAGVVLAGSAEAKYYNSYTDKSVCQTNGRNYINANPYYGRYECRPGNPGWWDLHVFPAAGNPQ
jgi:hypothetical protein